MSGDLSGPISPPSNHPERDNPNNSQLAGELQIHHSQSYQSKTKWMETGAEDLAGIGSQFTGMERDVEGDMLLVQPSNDEKVT